MFLFQFRQSIKRSESNATVPAQHPKPEQATESTHLVPNEHRLSTSSLEQPSNELQEQQKE